LASLQDHANYSGSKENYILPVLTSAKEFFVDAKNKNMVGPVKTAI
jgi:hypothetical protein